MQQCFPEGRDTPRPQTCRANSSELPCHTARCQQPRAQRPAESSYLVAEFGPGVWGVADEPHFLHGAQNLGIYWRSSPTKHTVTQRPSCLAAPLNAVLDVPKYHQWDTGAPLIQPFPLETQHSFSATIKCRPSTTPAAPSPEQGGISSTLGQPCRLPGRRGRVGSRPV